MDETGKNVEKPFTAHVLGAEQAGITQDIASRVGDTIVEAFRQRGRSVRVKGMRFIPSTKVEFGPGAFQVMANTIVEAVSPTGSLRRSEATDSVVTVSKAKGNVLDTVKISFLDHTSIKT